MPAAMQLLSRIIRVRAIGKEVGNVHRSDAKISLKPRIKIEEISVVQ
jgi:hypothetical protein